MKKCKLLFIGTCILLISCQTDKKQSNEQLRNTSAEEIIEPQDRKEAMDIGKKKPVKNQKCEDLLKLFNESLTSYESTGNAADLDIIFKNLNDPTYNVCIKNPAYKIKFDEFNKRLE